MTIIEKSCCRVIHFVDFSLWTDPLKMCQRVRLGSGTDGMDTHDAAEKLLKAYITVKTVTIAVSGKCTEIYPLNRNVISDTDFIGA